MLRPELLTLAELAGADAKRRGEQPNALALARVLSNRDRQAFETVFGSDACEQVAKGQLSAANPPSVEEILQPLGDASVPVVAEHLREVLGDLAAWVQPARGSNGAGSRPGPTASESADIRLHPVLELVSAEPALSGHAGAISEVLAQLSRRVPGNPMLLGMSGSGRTTFAQGLQAALEDAPPANLAGAQMVRIPIDRLLRGDPVGNLASALSALSDKDIAFIDDLEALLGLATGNYFVPAAMRLRGPLERPQQRLIVALDDKYLSRLENADEDLVAEMVVVPLPELPRDELLVIVEREAEELSEYHGVQIPVAIVHLALAPAPYGLSRAHPGLAIDRLDAACARAVLRGATAVDEDDLGLQDTPEIAPLAVDALLARVRDDVRGQDRALERVISRVALTRARLDLRPERPDAVLLLVGPTGVGKTQLARTLCRELFGDSERLIRLDMSEYADSWAISRLIGPQPGYVGYGEPDAWLTTRIRRQPRTVLLLDEIEKAHPAVWNTFLQVFDAGRLTDPRGNVADFGETVIILTSNIGSEAFSGPAIGFAARDQSEVRHDEEQRMLAAVTANMRPELINRLDDIIVFAPLSEASILEIAEREISAASSRLAERGYRVEIDSEVAELIAKTGYDPKYGARHLQRNLERLLLMPLAKATSRSLRAVVRDGLVIWMDASTGSD